ncbi:MAG: glutamine amidotransferase [Candidatus Brocadiia bacterium]
MPDEHSVAVAHPEDKTEPLIVNCGERPAGVYELQIAVRPSHVRNMIAFASGWKVNAGDKTWARYPGQTFARTHETERRECTVVHRNEGPLVVTIQPYADADMVEKSRTQTEMKEGGGPAVDDAVGDGGDDGGDGELGLDLTLDRTTSVYYIVDAVSIRPTSRSGRVKRVRQDKIRYEPGETLQGSAAVEDVGGEGGTGTLNIYLEHDVKDRRKVETMPVDLNNAPATIDFQVQLPEEELGYAVVAEFVSDDGQDRDEAAEYFTIAEDFNRVYIGGSVGGGHGSTKASEGRMRDGLESAMRGYVNVNEFFAWAEEDMVEMSPDTDYWFSGQTCYHIKKAGLKKMIELSHEYGIAQVSYAKFIMSGYLGWKTAYDYPSDHRGQYRYPVGMWEATNVRTLDKFRNKEFVIYENQTGGYAQNPFQVWWSNFLPIKPDATPRMVRISAEEVLRSAQMFGWDGIRWDGHPRAGGQRGGVGEYNARKARKTETLVRYFKDIVKDESPDFGFGYNYLMIQEDPNYKWARGDYEFNELCRGGGLIMNESIGNATEGRSYEFLANNLQVESDLVRERDAYFLGIGFAEGERDRLVESALWAAAGARPYNDACTTAVKRYMTRYAQYCLDENLGRIAEPEQVLKPDSETRLWWEPFVYETPETDGKRQLVINLLNVPLKAHRDEDDYRMKAGTDPVNFDLTLPDGIQARRVHLINPQTLEVDTTPVESDQFRVPAIGLWRVAVVDLEVTEDAPSLFEMYGPPETLEVPRQKETDQVPGPVVLDTEKEVREVNKNMSALAPDGKKEERDKPTEDSASAADRRSRLRETRSNNPAEKYLNGWWKGGTLPDDLKLKDNPPKFDDLTPTRNGRYDIFHGRGAMDYRLRLPECYARLERFQVHDAPLAGRFREGGGQRLVDNVRPDRMNQYDLMFYTSIPHCAMGVENSYGLVDYVKSGGAVMFTGGEYAFGKGGYMHTVLERELLPVLCVEPVDTRYTREGRTMEAGPDFSELEVDLDFDAEPTFWVWNDVLLKDDPRVKVFLQSGNVPILVGWELGEGRVVVLLTDHRGHSHRGRTAFFDWEGWPVLMEAVFRWLAPEAGTTARNGTQLSASKTRELVQKLEGEAMEGMLSETEEEGGDSGPEALLDDGDESSNGARELSDDQLKQRVATLKRLLRAPPSSKLSKAFVGQLTSVRNLPRSMRWKLLNALRSNPPDEVEEAVDGAMKSDVPEMRQVGYQLAALTGSKAFIEQLRGEAEASETDVLGRRRALALGVVLFPDDRLVQIGQKRVSRWNERARKRKRQYTDGEDFSLAAPEGPMLSKEVLFRRAAWLAYLSRYDAQKYGAQFAREWLKLSQYQLYCGRTIGNIRSDKEMSQSAKRPKVEHFREFRRYLRHLQGIMRPDLESLLTDAPEETVAGFKEAHFTTEFRAAMNVLGRYRPEREMPLLEGLNSLDNGDLADFVRAREAVAD